MLSTPLWNKHPLSSILPKKGGGVSPSRGLLPRSPWGGEISQDALLSNIFKSLVHSFKFTVLLNRDMPNVNVSRPNKYHPVKFRFSDSSFRTYFPSCWRNCPEILWQLSCHSTREPSQHQHYNLQSGHHCLRIYCVPDTMLWAFILSEIIFREIEESRKSRHLCPIKAVLSLQVRDRKEMICIYFFLLRRKWPFNMLHWLFRWRLFH